jgi:uncharacterized protein DUF3616
MLLSCGYCANSSPQPSAAAYPAVVFSGMCDASGAVPLDGRRFAVADDEDNVLRVYDAQSGGPPLFSVDLSPDLPLKKAKKPKKQKKNQREHSEDSKTKPRNSPELDLEAATRLGDHAYWLTSHGLNKKGRLIPARFILFATSIPREESRMTIVGTPYQHLLDDLLTAPALAQYALNDAAQRPPHEEGGLNLEGLTASADQKGMLIGFRNPIPNGRALIVPLLNPQAVLEGARAEFGEPLLLDLGGLGVRSLSWWRGRYLIAAGSFGSGGVSRLFVWDGHGEAQPVNDVDLSGLNIEAFFTPDERDEILVLSDDGAMDLDGTQCKDLDDPAQKRFRGRWLRAALGDSAPVR